MFEEHIYRQFDPGNIGKPLFAWMLSLFSSHVVVVVAGALSASRSVEALNVVVVALVV